MANLKQWILEAASGDRVESIVIGEMGWPYNYRCEDVPNYSQQPKGKILTWLEALPWIDYEFYSGFGSPGCNAVYAWTKNKCIWVTQYDGSTKISSMPRNPTECMPGMPGGG